MATLQPIVIDAADVSRWVARLWWPILRIGGFVVTAPIASETTIPAQVKIALSVALAFILSPLAAVPEDLSIFSGAGVMAAVQEVMIGIAIGLVVQLTFEALTFAGQSVSMSMGLGFATLIDPQHGADTPVLGQFFMIIGTLTYLAVNGHLVLIGALAASFKSLPIGAANIDRNLLWSMGVWGARIFETGLLVALPAVVALIIVNLALGVVTRAAPQLNLFGVGFTITLMSGFLVLIVGLDGLMVGISSLLESALSAVANLVGSPPHPVH
jgi:flagellar biosynthetic protein FliR